MTFSIRTTTHDPGDLSGRDADLAQAIVAIFHYSNPAFSIRFQPRIETNGTPVAIFTRFLGAGKIPLFHHIFSNQEGLKTAVLVNEFGEIGTDNDLVVSSSGNPFVA